jgi:hypothetical protein
MTPRMPAAAGAATILGGALLILGALWLCGQATARGSQPDGLAVFLIVVAGIVGLCMIVSGIARSSRPEDEPPPPAGPNP